MELNITYAIWAVVLIGSGYWLFRVHVRREYQNLGRLSIYSSFLELIFFAFHANMMYAFLPVSWSRIPPLSGNPILHAVSLICIILGFIILAVSMIPLGFRRTMGLKSKGLKTNGIYRLSRNPQVIGYSLLLIGYVVSYFSMYSLGWYILFGINIHWMVTAEEEYLGKLYGETYENYCLEVPRYLSAKSFRNIFRD
jgi:protein-S-isoprenylcysteine O-methyltransferase Ste14